MDRSCGELVSIADCSGQGALFAPCVRVSDRVIMWTMSIAMSVVNVLVEADLQGSLTLVNRRALVRSRNRAQIRRPEGHDQLR